MKWLALLWALTFPAWGQVQLLGVPATTSNEVLTFLQGMEISAELKGTLSPLLSGAFATGRATPHVSLLLLRQLSPRPREQVEEALTVFQLALAQGFIVDTGLTGSSLMNRVLMLLQMGQPWEQVVADLKLRYNLLVATRTVLLRYGVIGAFSRHVGEPLLPEDRLVLEVAWAVGDYLGQPPGALEVQVRGRLMQLRGAVLAPAVVDPLLMVLCPEMVQSIVVLAFQPERR